MTYEPTSTHTDHSICKCGEQTTRLWRINEIVGPVEVEEHCEFCGHSNIKPLEIVEEQ